MDEGAYRAINFDLCELKLKTVYANMTGHDYTYAYTEVGRFFYINNFEHRQHSGYFSKFPLSDIEVQRLIKRAVKQMPWLDKCVERFDVTAITSQWDLVDTIHESYKELFPEENDITKQFTNEKQENPVNVTRSKKI